MGKTLEEWVPIFAEHDVWHEKVQRTVAAVEDPQLIAAGCFTPIPAPPDAPADEPAMQVVNTAVDFDDRLTTVGGPTAALGEHTAEALASAGVGDQPVYLALGLVFAPQVGGANPPSDGPRQTGARDRIDL